MFQSLFSWNLPSKYDKGECILISYPCFNPCFLGTCPRRRDTAFSTLTSGYVSILVFLELALEATDALPGYKIIGFNPCFLGTCPRRLDNLGKW